MSTAFSTILTFNSWQDSVHLQSWKFINFRSVSTIYSLAHSICLRIDGYFGKATSDKVGMTEHPHKLD